VIGRIRVGSPGLPTLPSQRPARTCEPAAGFGLPAIAAMGFRLEEPGLNVVPVLCGTGIFREDTRGHHQQAVGYRVKDGVGGVHLERPDSQSLA
jgi:hypothetical protein